MELDQNFLCGKSAGKTGGSSDKVPITVAVKRTPRNRLGRVRLEVAEKAGFLDIIDFATEVSTPGTVIRTDGATMFKRLTGLDYSHEPSPGTKNSRVVEAPLCVRLRVVGADNDRWVGCRTRPSRRSNRSRRALGSS